MFKYKGNYPYPVLTNECIDYKNSKMTVRYLYKSLKDAHAVKIECKIENDEIKQLIKEKKACVAVQIESSSAFFRKMFEFFDYDNIEIELKNDEVADLLEIGVAILAKEKLEHYTNRDFIDLYKDMRLTINKNELLGVYPSVKQPIANNQEILKEVTNIFVLNEGEEFKMITYDSNGSRILVNVPKEVGKIYKRSKGNVGKMQLMNTMIFIPVLTNVISDIKEQLEDEMLNTKIWYKTLYNKIKDISVKQERPIDDLCENAFQTAQEIMKNMLVESFDKLEYLLETVEDNEGEGDDE